MDFEFEESLLVVVTYKLGILVLTRFHHPLGKVHPAPKLPFNKQQAREIEITSVG